MLKKLFCLHRHPIKDHPACFASGEVNESIAQELVQESKVEWYQLPEYRIGIIDIESDGLKADFSTMLSWAIKTKDGDTSFDCITKKELFNGTTEQRILKSLIKKMSEYKILVSYYGTGFDLPYIRTKALHYNIPFPSYGELYHFDLYYTVKNKLCLSRNSLDNACNYLGISGKTPLEKDVWRLAKYGDKGALELVVDHNVADCEITEKLYEKLVPFRKWMKRSI